MKKPNHYFKSIHEAAYRGEETPEKEPTRIEYLKMWTGETYIHICGTAFWDFENKCLDIQSLILAGVTHFRVLEN